MWQSIKAFYSSSFAFVVLIHRCCDLHKKTHFHIPSSSTDSIACIKYFCITAYTCGHILEFTYSNPKIAVGELEDWAKDGPLSADWSPSFSSEASKRRD